MNREIKIQVCSYKTDRVSIQRVLFVFRLYESHRAAQDDWSSVSQSIARIAWSETIFLIYECHL